MTQKGSPAESPIVVVWGFSRARIFLLAVAELAAKKENTVRLPAASPVDPPMAKSGKTEREKANGQSNG